MAFDREVGEHSLHLRFTALDRVAAPDLTVTREPRASGLGGAALSGDLVEAPDAQPSEVSQPGSEVARVEEDPDSSNGLTQVVKLAREGDTVKHEANLGDVIDAARGGQVLMVRAVRERAGGSFEIYTTEAMLPEDAIVNLDSDPVKPPQAAGGFRPTVYARLTLEYANPSDPSRDQRRQPEPAPQPPEPPQQGLRLDNVSKGTDAPVEIIYAGVGIPSDVQQSLFNDMHSKYYDAKETTGKEKDAAVLGAAVDQLSEGMGTAGLRRGVVVGAQSQKDLDRLAAATANSVLVPPPGARWVVERNSAYEIIPYPSLPDALTAGHDDPAAIVCAREFVRGGGLPAEHVAGLGIEPIYRHDTVQDIRPGATVAEIGHKMTNRNVVLEEPVRLDIDSLRRHGIVGGTTDSGKTAFLDQLGAAVLAAGIDRHRVHPDIPPPKIVYVSHRKAGDLGKDAVAMLRAMGYDVRLRCIRPGAPGVNAIIDIFDGSNNTPRGRAQDGIDALTAGIRGDPDTIRISERYTGDGVRGGLQGLGENLATNLTGAGIDATSRLTYALGGWMIRRELRSGTYDPKVTGNLEQFTAGPMENARFRTGGAFFQGGHPIQGSKLLGSPDVVDVFELGEMEGPSDRQIGHMALMNILYRAKVAALREQGLTATPHLGLLIISDEAYGMTGNTPAGGRVAEGFALHRAAGVGYVMAQQTGHEHMHAQVIGNTGLQVFFRTLSRGDRDALEHYASAPPGQVDFIGNPNLPPGVGLMAGGGFTLGRIVTRNPADIPMDTIVEAPVEEIIDIGSFERAYTGETMAAAEELLRHDPWLLRLRLVIELNAHLLQAGRPQLTLEPEGQLLTMLTNTVALDPEKVACAIDIACEYAGSRKQIRGDGSRKLMARTLKAPILARLRGEEMPPNVPPPELVLNFGLLGPVETFLDAALIAPALANAEYAKFKEIIGQDIGGISAQEMLTDAKRMRDITFNALSELIVGARASSGLDQSGVDRAAHMLFQLIGGAAVPDERVAEIRREIAVQLERPMSEPEEAAFAAAAQKTLADPRLQNGQSASVHGYSLLIHRLQGLIQMWRDKPGIDLSPYSKNYPHLTLPDKTMTRGQQRDALDTLGANIVQASGYTVPLVDTLNPFDLLSGDHTLTNVLAALAALPRPQGDFHDTHRAHYGSGGEPEGIVTALEVNDKATQAALAAALANAMYGSDFTADNPGVTVYLARVIGRLQQETKEVARTETRKRANRPKTTGDS